MSNLSPTARVILGLLALGDRTGYDMKQTIDRSTRFFWGASYGQIYPELRRLERAGLVTSREDPRGGVQRRAFELTEAGRAELDAWLTADGPDTFLIRDEGLLRLFFAALVGEDDVLRLVRRRHAWFLEVAEQFRAIGRESFGDEEWPPVLHYGIELMEWNARWFGALEGRLTSDDPDRPRPPDSPPARSRGRGHR
jgi:DNA-binding PadR family transcriptional regulator